MKAALLVLFAAGAIIALVFWFSGEVPTKPQNSGGATAASVPAARHAVAAATNPEPALPNPGGTPLPLTSVPSVTIPTETDVEHRHFKRYFKTQLKPSLRDIAKQFQNGRPARISVPLFDGKEAIVVVDDFTAYGENAGAFSGKIEGDEGSFANIAFFDDAESGSIQFPAQNLVYAIQPVPDGSVLIGEVDVAALGACGNCGGPAAGKEP